MYKVNELMREIIAEAVSELKDPRIGFVTITGVDTSPDLRHAVVYFSVLGTAEEEAATASALASAAADAKAERAPDAVVLLSPASASFDQFASFEARGDAFRKFVLAMAAGEG